MLYGKEHVDRYVATDGEEGYALAQRRLILILTTTGRKSGEERTNALIFGGTVTTIWSSLQGRGSSTALVYLNLVAHPEVHVQVKGDRFAAHARTATAEEKPELWKTMTAIWPDYDGISSAPNVRFRSSS